VIAACRGEAPLHGRSKRNAPDTRGEKCQQPQVREAIGSKILWERELRVSPAGRAAADDRVTHTAPERFAFEEFDPQIV
jgi:hypothetical protein